MKILVHPSAMKHGIAEQDILYAAQWAIWIEPLDEDCPQRELRLGFDKSGRLLELVVLIFDSGDEMVIHAMKARPQYLDLLANPPSQI